MPRTRVETRARARALQALYAWDMRGDASTSSASRTQVWDDLAVPPTSARSPRPLVRRRRAAAARSSTPSSPTSRPTGASSASARSSAACCGSAAAELDHRRDAAARRDPGGGARSPSDTAAREREVRQRRARRARAPHGADVVRLLVVNWQDRENPQAGGAEIHLHEIFGRLAAHGHEVTLLCGGWPGCPPRATLDGIDVYRVGTRHTFPFLARRHFRAHLARPGFDLLVEDINKVPLYTPRWGGRRVVALVPHLFGGTAFQELRRAARRRGVARPSGRSGACIAACRSRRSARARPTISRARGIPRAVGRGDLSRRRHGRLHARCAASAPRRPSSRTSAGSSGTRACISSFARSPR